MLAGPDLTAAPCDVDAAPPPGRTGSGGGSVEARAQGSRPERPLEAALSPQAPLWQAWLLCWLWEAGELASRLQEGFDRLGLKALAVWGLPAPHAQAVPERASREVQARPGGRWSRPYHPVALPPCPGSQQQTR